MSNNSSAVSWDEGKNAFDLIRIGLAAVIMYSHACQAGNFTHGWGQLVKGQVSSFGLLGFFGISGYLLTRSFDLRKDWWTFARARVLRLVPGYYFALLVTAFILAPLIAACNTQGGSWEFLDAVRYVSGNIFMRIRVWTVGGTVNGLHYNGSINGPLWSLFPAVCYCMLVLLLGVMGWIRNRANVLLLCIAALVLHVALILSPDTAFLAPTVIQLSHTSQFLLSFLVGATAYLFRHELQLGWQSALLWVMLTCIVLRNGGWNLVGPLFWPLALINLAYSRNVKLPYDLSYGIFVMHYPVLQLFVATRTNQQGFFAYFSVSLAITLLLAAVSYFCVEVPMLRFKSR